MTDETTALLHPLFLPYAESTLLEHFAAVPGSEHADPARHLARWRQRIEGAKTRDDGFLERDETLWTAGALLAVHYSENPVKAWKEVLERTFGPRPSIVTLESWDACLAGKLCLFFEVGLSSPESYRKFLSEHIADPATRHPLKRRVEMGQARGLALEGRTHLDALLLNRDNGFAVHFEAKVLSDIDAKITFDAIRNQIARNLDCMLEQSKGDVLGARRPEHSLFALLTPALFRRRPHSRLYGQLMREYMGDPSALARDLPHRALLTDSSLSRRIGWLAFEDIAEVVPGSCPWLKHDPPTPRPRPHALDEGAPAA